MGNILIVDDSKLVRLRLSTILENDNHDIIGMAKDGEEAIKLFIESKPDLILMDITMPVMNGIDAIKKILNIDGSARIIVCSAMDQQKIVIEVVELGALDFIVKPFQDVQVLETVNHQLKQLIGSV